MGGGAGNGWEPKRGAEVAGGREREREKESETGKGLEESQINKKTETSIKRQNSKELEYQNQINKGEENIEKMH